MAVRVTDDPERDYEAMNRALKARVEAARATTGAAWRDRLTAHAPPTSGGGTRRTPGPPHH